MAQVHTSLLTEIRKRFVCLSTAVFCGSNCIVLKRIDVLDKHRPHPPCSSPSLYNVLQVTTGAFFGGKREWMQNIVFIFYIICMLSSPSNFIMISPIL